MRRRTRLTVVGDHGTAPFAVAADRLGWKVRTDDRPPDCSGADMVVVGTDIERRIADAHLVSDRGVPVVLVPARLAAGDLDWTPTGPLVIGDTLPTAPAVQRWFALLSGLDGVDHVSITCAQSDEHTSEPLTFSAFGIAHLTAQALRSTSVDDVLVTVEPSGLARFEMQCSTPSDVVRVDVFPVPTVEHNGVGVSVAGSDHPATAFGAVDLLRTFAADIADDREPVLGLAYLSRVVELLADRSA